MTFEDLESWQQARQLTFCLTYYQGGSRIKHYGIAAKRRRTRKNEENCTASHLLCSM